MSIRLILFSTSNKALPANSRRMSRIYGFKTALPLSNMGRFWSSTIWMSRPSGVISRRICEPKSCNFGLLEMAAAILALSAASLAHPSGGFGLRLLGCQLLGAFVGAFAALGLAGALGAGRHRPIDHAGAGACATTTLHGDLEWRLKTVVGYALLVAFGGAAKQPHQQEESHHGGHEIGIGNLPGTPWAAWPLSDPLDDDGLSFFASPAMVQFPCVLLLPCAFPVPRRSGAPGGIQDPTTKLDCRGGL